MHNGTLFIVATPIGNLQDITLRAVEVLKSVDYIACEDTRKTGILLKSLHMENHPMLISFYEQNENSRIPNILNLLINDKNVALVSDGGTPTISDPGFKLVRECVKQGINVIPIPGPSAVISALSTSGLPTDKFIFLGFLPRKPGHRIKLLENLKDANAKLEATVVIYEAPHRLTKILVDINKVFGNISLTIARELTKIHEEKIESKVEDLISKYEKQPPKGEIVVLFNPKNF